jgi:hypothetical protein
MAAHYSEKNQIDHVFFLEVTDMAHFRVFIDSQAQLNLANGYWILTFIAV